MEILELLVEGIVEGIVMVMHGDVQSHARVLQLPLAIDIPEGE